MNLSRHLRFSFIAVFSLVLVVALASCSKKDVRADEPGFNPSEGDGGGGAAAMGEGAPSAGEAGGATSTDLQTVFFGYDSYALNADSRNMMKTNAQYLKDHPAVTIQIEGHCDERGTEEYNRALGERRANAVRSYMEKIGIEASRLSVISYGESQPAVQGHDESAWSQNRRASFVITSK